MANLGSLGCDGTLSDDRAMRYYAEVPRLRKLRAQGSAATDEGFISLARSATLESFWGTGGAGIDRSRFAALSKMPSLRVLGVSLKNVDDESLARLPQFPALRELTPIDVEDPGFRHTFGNASGWDSRWCACIKPRHYPRIRPPNWHSQPTD